MREDPQACMLSVVQGKQVGHWGARGEKRNGTRKTCGGEKERRGRVEKKEGHHLSV